MSKRVIASVAAVLAVFVSPSFADTWSGAYDNTIVSTYDSGKVVDVYVEPDHTYSIVPRDGSDEITGVWADEGSQSCFTIKEPASYAGGDPLCFPLKDYQVGDTFEGADSTGHFVAKIVKGRS